jgi:hypothetical protein
LFAEGRGIWKEKRKNNQTQTKREKKKKQRENNQQATGKESHVTVGEEGREERERKEKKEKRVNDFALSFSPLFFDLLDSLPPLDFNFLL